MKSDLLGTVWRGAWLGSLAGGLVWVLGSLSTMPSARVDAGVWFAVDRRDPAALAWALLALLVIIAPAGLVGATFAAILGLLLPIPLARDLAVGGWGWATIWSTSIIPAPTVTGTVLSPLGDYAAHGWMHAPALHAWDGVALLSPPATAASAATALAALLASSVVLLLLARVLRAVRG